MIPRRLPTSGTIWRSWANSNGVSNSHGELRNSIRCIRAGTISALPGSTTTEKRMRTRLDRLRRSDYRTFIGLICWTQPPRVNCAAQMPARHCRGFSISNRTFQHTSNCENGTHLRTIWIISWRAFVRLDGMIDSDPDDRKLHRLVVRRNGALRRTRVGGEL